MQKSIDLAEVARLAVADVVALAEARNIEVSLDAQGPIPVHGNAPDLRILVRNLADNAIRYTPAGGRVDIALRAGNDGALLTVDDSGPGIPADERERVFDRFYRRKLADDAAAEIGSGLGLAIVRTIAEQHGASVALNDSHLGGLRVLVRLAA